MSISQAHQQEFGEMLTLPIAAYWSPICRAAALITWKPSLWLVAIALWHPRGKCNLLLSLHETRRGIMNVPSVLSFSLTARLQSPICCSFGIVSEEGGV